MHSARRAVFANDNDRLSASHHDAIRFALSLPDAQTLRAALREKLEEIRLRSSRRETAEVSARQMVFGRPVALTLVARE